MIKTETALAEYMRVDDARLSTSKKGKTMRQEIVTTVDDNNELAIVEANARQAFNDAVYQAQVAWHNENERLHRQFQDSIEDNAEKYRQAMVQAQRKYRDSTADRYVEAA